MPTQSFASLWFTVFNRGARHSFFVVLVAYCIDLTGSGVITLCPELDTLFLAVGDCTVHLKRGGGDIVSLPESRANSGED